VGATAPAGFHFNLTIDDEFPHDTTINLSLWTCGVPCSNFPGQIYLNSNGLNLQPTAAVSGCTSGTGYRACDAGIGSNFAPRFGVWEWSAKYPSDVSGEGDGYHIDIYLNNNGSTDRTGYQEMSTGESGLGTSSANYATAYCCGNNTDGTATVAVNTNINSPTRFSDAFHTFDIMWVNDGVGNGAVSGYLDGSALWTGGRQGPWWGSSGASMILESVSCFTPQAIGWNGNPCSANTATSGNPFVFRYFRYWQLVPN
jgi:hypothetical protein